MKQKRNQGAVAVYVLLSIIVLLTLSLGVASYGTQSLVRIKRDRNSMTAVQASYAALDHMTGKAYWQLTSGAATSLNSQSADLSSDLNAIAPGCTATGWVTPASNITAYITADVTYKGITRSVRNLVKAKNVGIWNNAIFAGSGATGQAINGNVDIRGSMHILGDGEPYLDLYGLGYYFAGDAYTDSNHNVHWDPGEPFTDPLGSGQYAPPDPYKDFDSKGKYDPPMTQTSLDSSFSGNAYVGNNYSGAPASLLAQMPAIPTVGGVGTLSTEVRVKHGEISISGTATLGTNSIVDGGASKNTLDGVYVSDGFTGNKGVANVYSDNGTSNTYDLGNLGIQFPVISGIGAQTYVDKSGTSWTNEKNYLDSKALVIPITTILANTAAFSYGPDANGNKITFVPGSPGTLNITGVVKVAGNLQIGAKNSDIAYTGNGTIYSTGSINVDGNVLPAAGKVFPTTARLGMIAAQDLNLSTGNGSSQLSMAGAFYAQGTITSAKQNQIAGTFVASYFNMGTNVPKIYQVPSLVNNMPPAMPGDKNYYSFTIQTVRDRSPKNGQTDSFSGGSPYSTSGGGGAQGSGGAG